MTVARWAITLMCIALTTFGSCHPSSNASRVPADKFVSLQLGDHYNGADSVYQHGFQLGQIELSVVFQEVSFERQSHELTLEGRVLTETGEPLSSAMLAFGKGRVSSSMLRLQNAMIRHCDSLGHFRVAVKIDDQEVMVVNAPFYIARVFQLSRLLAE